MKKTLSLFVATAFIVSSFSFSSSSSTEPLNVPAPAVVNASKIMIPVGNSGKKISLLELSRINRQELENLTGKKMSLFEKMAFKKTQKRLKKGIKDDGTITDKRLLKFMNRKAAGNTEGFHGLGFVLGFFLGILGVLLAYVINDDEDKRNRVKWAWLGFGIGALLYIILIVAVFSSVY
jgi:hypothetical protein